MYWFPLPTRVPSFCREWPCLLTVSLLLFGSGPATCSVMGSDDGAALEHALHVLPDLGDGQDLGQLRPIVEAANRAGGDESLRGELQRRLIGVIQGEATDLAKEFACRQLAVVASDDAVPAVVPLLPNVRLGHMSRYVLEALGSDAAREGLRAALRSTNGRQRTGVVISLGRLADPAAVAAIAETLQEDDDELRDAALMALGRIGTAEAAAAIRAFSAREPGLVPDRVVAALTEAADRLRERGLKDDASDIYRSLVSAPVEQVRAAGYRGLILVDPEGAVTLIRDGLAAEQSWMRQAAADCLVDGCSSSAVAAIAAAVDELPEQGAVAALHGLRAHRSSEIRLAALRAVERAEDEVRRAALSVLVLNATREDVPRLAGWVSDPGRDQPMRDAAAEVLRWMPAEGTNEALSDWIMRGEDEDIDADVIGCAASRRDVAMVPAFLKAAAAPSAATRLAALRALEILAGPEHVAALIGLLSRSPAGEEREAAGRAVWLSCQKIPEPTDRSAPLLAALESADASVQAVLLPVLGRFGDERSWETIHAAMASPNRAIRDAGYRGLANWPDPRVADELLEIARDHAVEAYRLWALRGYARVVALPHPRPAAETFRMLNEALQLASRREDRELFVARLAAVRVPESLERLLELLQEAELRDATVPAIFELAKGLSQSHPEQARAALEIILSLTEDAALKQQIPKVLRDIDNAAPQANQ